MAGKRKAERNPAAELIAAVGGPIQAAAKARVRLATIYDWRGRGYIRLLGPAKRLVEALGVSDAEQLRWLRDVAPPADD